MPYITEERERERKIEKEETIVWMWSVEKFEYAYFKLLWYFIHLKMQTKKSHYENVGVVFVI